MSFYKYICKKIIIKIKATLQVRNIYCKRTYKRASLSVEAAMVMSLFIFAVVTIMQIFRIMDVHRSMLAIAELECKRLCEYAYIENALQKDNDIRLDYVSKAGTKLLLSYDIQSKIDNSHVKNISTIRSKMLEDGEHISVVIDYAYELPFSIYNIGKIKQSAISYRRAWIGAAVSAKDENQEDMEDRIVYVGKGSTRYHNDRHCHYLYNDISAVSIDEVAGIRNSSGAKYKPCDRCGSAAAGTVYIMPAGTSYHTSRDCSAITAYVREVRLSEVKHMGACSYCGGGE